jgi:hypothetical protein
MARSARRLGYLFAVLALTADPAGRAEAGIITTQAVTLDQQFVTPVDALRFSFGAAADGQTFALTPGVNLTPADVGSSVLLDSSSDPGFDALAVLLTNGADDTTRVSYDPIGSGSEPVDLDAAESAFFTDPALTGPDLGGVALDRISLRVDSLSIEIDGVDGNRTNVLFSGTLIFEDAAANPVPAPPSAVLAGVAGVMFAARAVRRRRAA